MESPFAAVAIPSPDPGRGLRGLRGLLSSKRSLVPSVQHETSAGSWDALPLHLWQAIFALVQGSSDAPSRRDMFAVVAVCRSWRRAAFHQYFLRLWHQPSDIVHPLQLLRLSGRAVPGTLLQCFVRREEMPKHGVGSARYSMYLGTGPGGPGDCKLLLSALQTTRRGITIHLDRDCTLRPIARVQCSLLQMSYRAVTTSACPLPFVEELTRPLGRDGTSALSRALSSPLLGRGARVTPAGGGPEARLPPVLAECKYQLRLKGFMRPRKMQVTLPHPAELACFDVDAAATVKRLASVTASCPLPPGLLPAASAPPSALDAISTTGAHPIKRSASGAAAALMHAVRRSLHLSGASVMAAATSAPPGLDAAADAALDALALGTQPPQAPGTENEAVPLGVAGLALGMAAEAVGVVGGESSEPRGPRERLPLGLRNKQPHWNHNLRCHCLNFHGRVKEASVKNYQLVATDPVLAATLVASAEPPARSARQRPSRTARAVAMQFGKVDEHLFVLDFNPTFMSALQAFCVALTNFDCKLIL